MVDLPWDALAELPESLRYEGGTVKLLADLDGRAWPHPHRGDPVVIE